MKTEYLQGAAIIALVSIINLGCSESDDASTTQLATGTEPSISDTTSASGTDGSSGGPTGPTQTPPGVSSPAMTPPATTVPSPPMDSTAAPAGSDETPDSMDPSAGLGGTTADPGPEPEDLPNASGGSDPSSGGVPGSGGAAEPGEPSGGSGGNPSSPPEEASASDGCGMAAPPACTPCQADGLDYYVDIPDDYDNTRPYPVVFQYHPLGGSGQGARTMYRVEPNFPDAIYVSPDGSDNGFPNQGGRDEAVTREIMASIEATLCIDRARYFATGFSYGGSMSYTAACNMSDKFRAVAAMAGAPISGASCTSQEPERPVAVLGIHGEEDTALPITMAEPIIETWIEKNGCSGDTQPSDITGSDCATMASALATGEYQGCMEGYPVIWCPIPDYPHNIPSWSGGAIAAFFQLF